MSDSEAAAEPGEPGNVINPRLSDVFDLVIRQDEVDFVVPHLREDLPLSLDPFLLWKSGKPEYRALHANLLGFIEEIRRHAVEGRATKARMLLTEIAEPVELGLGYSAGTKQGSALGPATISGIVDTFLQIPQMQAMGLDHVEVLALLVPGIAEDRLSDLTACVIKGWLADFTVQRCSDYGIPTRPYRIITWDATALDWCSVAVRLPFHPANGTPILLAPLDLLRRLPWINYGDYYKTTYAPLILPPGRHGSAVSKPDVLAYNRAHYEMVRSYVVDREAHAAACSPDPLFAPLKLTTVKKKVAELKKLATGRDHGEDKKFEALTYDVLTTLLYPELDLAAAQSRTVSGAHIRDVIFHNDGKTPFLNDLRDLHGARQAVFELKNVAQIETEHVNQLYRYLDDEDMGKFGILVGRVPPRASVLRNIVDLHSSKRAAVLCLDDSDLDLMISLIESGRRPVEALRKKYVEFTRRLPK